MEIKARAIFEPDGKSEEQIERQTGLSELKETLRKKVKMEDFDQVIEELQASIIEEARKIYPEKFIEHWLRSKNIGKMDHPDGFARITGPCGDTIEISLNVRDGTITDTKFTTDGCAATIACGSICAELANGKSIKDALSISQEVIWESLGGLPKEDVHCALLASNTLQQVIRNYQTEEGIKGVKCKKEKAGMNG